MKLKQRLKLAWARLVNRHYLRILEVQTHQLWADGEIYFIGVLGDEYIDGKTGERCRRVERIFYTTLPDFKIGTIVRNITFVPTYSHIFKA